MAKHRQSVDKPMSALRQRPLTLRLYPDSILRRKADHVIMFGAVLEDFFHMMLDFMWEERGIGLAAPQVGVAERLVVADTGEGPVCLANPEILDRAGSDTMDEGCLSLPGIVVEVERNAQIELRGQDHRGKKVEFEATGLLARVLQHEVNHLDGVLICDHGQPWTAGSEAR